MRTNERTGIAASLAVILSEAVMYYILEHLSTSRTELKIQQPAPVKRRLNMRRVQHKFTMMQEWRNGSERCPATAFVRNASMEIPTEL